MCEQRGNWRGSANTPLAGGTGRDGTRLGQGQLAGFTPLLPDSCHRWNVDL